MGNGIFNREYPILRFEINSYKADHSQDIFLIETKYLRAKTSPSAASNGIAADITFVQNAYVLYFIVYDPEHQILSDDDFIHGFESTRNNCFIRIYR
jgi:hypothetical protein